MNKEARCWKCNNIVIEATLGIPYFLCEQKQDMEAETCEKYAPEEDEHDRAYEHV